MLTELHISNFAIIDDLVIPLGEGLNILTGETGAGKSIIIEALRLITGDKASNDVIRSGAREAFVIALFDTTALPGELKNILKELGHESEELVIKRVIFPNGKTKVYINGLPVSFSELKRVSSYLLEISSQHEHQKLLDTTSHLGFVDRFGNYSDLMQEFRTEYEKFLRLKTRLGELERLSATATEQGEYLRFQIKEISVAELAPGEDATLENEKNVVKNAARLHEKMTTVESLLDSSEPSVNSSLGQVLRQLQGASEFDSGIDPMLKICTDAAVTVQELIRGVSEYLNRLDVDPSRVEEIESRLYEIMRLKKKYGESIEKILAVRDELEERLKTIDNCEAELRKTTEELEGSRARLKSVAFRLSKKRIEASKKLAESVQRELDSLGLKKTTFAPGHEVVELELVDETGLDRFNFEISPNAGEPLKPLSKIASGGELSRIMLAIKGVLADRANLAMLEVYDEVDVGIGGAVAEEVGKKLKEMSRKRQIVCITHLPQVAVYGDRHIRVLKTVANKRTVTRFELLGEKERTTEVARMLGGFNVTKVALEHATELLKRSKT